MNGTARTERSGNVQRRFTVHGTTGKVQVDKLTHAKEEVTTVWVKALSAYSAIFLPEGYPNTVSSDYITYQCYDTMQALCSSVTGTLSTRSILRGVGVGEASATALSGTVQWIIRDGVGMVGRIGFATKIASDLDNDAKRWRFVADLTNDVALMLDILSSYLPAEYWLITVCVAALFRSVTGVAGGATRSSLTQHFAVCDNTADVSAKDGSQETGVNLIGMFLGMFIAWAVPETFGPTALVFCFFTGLHLYANYWGVRSLLLCHLNEARATLCLGMYLDSHVMSSGAGAGGRGNKIPTPAEIKDLEPVVGHLNLNNSCGGNFGMSLRLGASLYEVLHHAVAPCGPNYLEKVKKEVDDSLEGHGYAVVVHHEARWWLGGGVTKGGKRGGNKPTCVSVILAEGIDATQLLQAWTLARGGVVPGQAHGSMGVSSDGIRESFNRPFVVTPTGQFLKFSTVFQSKLQEQGWMLNRLQLALRDWRVQDVGPKSFTSQTNSQSSDLATTAVTSRASTRQKSQVGFSAQTRASKGKARHNNNNGSNNINNKYSDSSDNDDMGEMHRGGRSLPRGSPTMIDLDDGMSPMAIKALTPMRKTEQADGASKTGSKRSSSIRRRGTSFTRD